MELRLLPLTGLAARPHAGAIAQLRLAIFRDYPYLYAGDLAYETAYLETYFRAEHSFVLLVQDGDRTVGATTCILASEEEESFCAPFVAAGLDPAQICYFGESLLLPAYRGRGLGKVFFRERENFARTLPDVKALAFCAVVRPDDHPLRPEGYRPLNQFWRNQGFRPAPGMVTEYEWPDVGTEGSTKKKMQYWLKPVIQEHA